MDFWSKREKWALAVTLLAGLGFGAAFLYVRHSRSLTAQEQTLRMLQHLDEGSARIGGVKGNDGSWSFPTVAGTNAAGSQHPLSGTN
jgi:hypothetical protein